jgi:lipopolysaccharide heptosyltransferase I
VTRVLVVRLGSLGDLVHTLPAVAAIRRTLPRVDIDWLVDAVHEEFLSFVPVLTSVVRLDAPTPGGWARAVRRLRARRYDAVLDFQGLVKSAALARLSGARRVIGFDRRSLREASAAAFYNERVVVPGGLHVIQKNLCLAAAIAGSTTGALEFPIERPSSSALETVRSAAPDGFVLINPGAAWPNKRWPPERFGRLARWIHDHHGWRPIVLWGPGERELAAGVVRHSGGIALEAPPTRLADLIALGRDARLMVSGDTGPVHIAAAVGTPIVALFGPTDPDRNGPWRPDDEALTRYDRCDCHYERRCRRSPDRWCLGTISDDDVQQAVTARLGRPG